jgi:hypothetical protein
LVIKLVLAGGIVPLALTEGDLDEVLRSIFIMIHLIDFGV